MECKTTAHIISHSHWDREWYMPFEKHRYHLVKLMDTLIDLFEKGEDFKSFHLDGQMIILDDYFQIHPDKKEWIKKLIQEKKASYRSVVCVTGCLFNKLGSECQEYVIWIASGKGIRCCVKGRLLPGYIRHLRASASNASAS